MHDVDLLFALDNGLSMCLKKINFTNDNKLVENEGEKERKKVAYLDKKENHLEFNAISNQLDEVGLSGLLDVAPLVTVNSQLYRVQWLSDKDEVNLLF